MAKLTEAQKRANKVQGVLDRFKTLRIGKCVNQTAAKWQLLVRLRAIEPDGKLTCCSCGKRDFPGKGFDAGHWIGRSSKSVIFDGRNCHPQCVACNQYGVGPVKAGYDDFMRRKYGAKALRELIRLANTTKQWTREELAELYVGYLEAIRETKREANE